MMNENAWMAENLTMPFIQSTTTVFSKMLGWNLELEATESSNRFQSNHDVSGIIGFSGALRGTIVIGIDQEVALAAAAFFGGKPTAIDAGVMDMVGELANMIGGSAKDRLITSGVNLGLPTVICGKGHRVSNDPGATVELLSFTCPHGPITVEVGIRFAENPLRICVGKR